ncbi:hypothetical protein CANARDRAFT_20468 [[Candida] arabinofermentans NRRL YB-2248]|uniref:Uncharacterized protein n=1 Tax=[Candida] arabinofermentans NRRL YB-2248 TaxID=983967 RepID=A0A1E4T7W0_9ASCO|nr:hypothetical protein CANARDRAFT_20468 [[Candida] arabinofermentans NRRL YB-2248]
MIRRHKVDIENTEGSKVGSSTTTDESEPYVNYTRIDKHDMETTGGAPKHYSDPSPDQYDSDSDFHSDTTSERSDEPNTTEYLSNINEFGFPISEAERDIRERTPYELMGGHQQNDSTPPTSLTSGLSERRHIANMENINGFSNERMHRQTGKIYRGLEVPPLHNPNTIDGVYPNLKQSEYVNRTYPYIGQKGMDVENEPDNYGGYSEEAECQKALLKEREIWENELVKRQESERKEAEYNKTRRKQEETPKYQSFEYSDNAIPNPTNKPDDIEKEYHYTTGQPKQKGYDDEVSREDLRETTSIRASVNQKHKLTNNLRQKQIKRPPPLKDLPMFDNTNDTRQYLTSESEDVSKLPTPAPNLTPYFENRNTIYGNDRPISGYFNSKTYIDADSKNQPYFHQQMSSSLNFSAVPSELPQYPISPATEMRLPHHHHGPLRGKHRKIMQKISGLQSSHSLHNSSNTDLASYVSGESQQLKLKTTLRKEKPSRKEFNGAKPWKYHSDAVIVSEDEKKRYEGIWAANKGVYMDYEDDKDETPDAKEENNLPSVDFKKLKEEQLSSSHSGFEMGILTEKLRQAEISNKNLLKKVQLFENYQRENIELKRRNEEHSESLRRIKNQLDEVKELHQSVPVSAQYSYMAYAKESIKERNIRIRNAQQKLQIDNELLESTIHTGIKKLQNKILKHIDIERELKLTRNDSSDYKALTLKLHQNLRVVIERHGGVCHCTYEEVLEALKNPANGECDKLRETLMTDVSTLIYNLKKNKGNDD